MPTVDRIRGLYSRFGLRPYRVYMIWIGWTPDEDGDGRLGGDELLLDLEDAEVPGLASLRLRLSPEGVGRPVLLKEVELLPTPLVQGFAGVQSELEATGLTERGLVTVSQISGGYTEDQLQGLAPEFRDPRFPDSMIAGISHFYEIQENRPANFSSAGTAASWQFRSSDLRSPRRRFSLAGAPTRSPDGFQWTLQLGRADGERGRQGEVEGVVGEEE